LPQWNLLFGSFVGLYLLQLVLTLGMERLNRDHQQQQGVRVPEGFEDFLDEQKMKQTIAYSGERSRFGSIHLVFSELVFLGLILWGFFPFLDNLLRHLSWNAILTGLLFFAIPGLLNALLDLPFDYYQAFVLEEKYGFNRSTLKIWILDHLKTGLLSLLLLALIFSLILWLIQAAPHYWWVWGFLFLSLFQLVLAVLYPVLIAPLFNTFEAIQEEDLKEKIAGLMKKAGVGLKGIFQMDAGKRSGHTNAYFTGLGKTKRVVLFDTLLQAHPQEEILGILAHELGHYKGRHILKLFLLFEISTLAGLYLAARFLDWSGLYSSFGFGEPQAYSGLFLLGLIGQKAGFFLVPFSLALSRRFERQADDYALAKMGTAEPLIRAFKRMAADNLTNLNPHPLYVRFHYSHPPLVERIHRLRKSTD
jgi:STE24 endopeptidase